MKKKVVRVQGLKLAVISVFVLIALVCVSGNLFESSVAARSQGGGLAAPTGLTASDNSYYTKVGLHWDTIKGANLYRVYRSLTNNSGAATSIGTTAANYFFDTNTTQGTPYFYWVKAENGVTQSDFSAAESGTCAMGTLEPGAPLLPLDPPLAPAGNDVTASKAYLGKALFWDEQLSSTKTVSCGTCHRASAGGSDPRTAVNNPNTTNPGFDNTFGTPDDVFGSAGVPVNNANGTYSMSSTYGLRAQVTGRKAPSYLNAGYARNGIFWDGRASDEFRDPITNAIILGSRAGLESQVLGPPVSSAEMGHTGRDWTQVASRVAGVKPLAVATDVPAALETWISGRTYPQLFEEVFGTPDVTPARIAMAIATHERTLFSDRAPLDKIAYNPNELTQQESEGRDLFSSLRCNICHVGTLGTDNQFHNIGVSAYNTDPGRFAVTNNEEDRARFKTPNLRNVELHGPYMHNGRFQTLEEVVEFYDRGGDFTAPNLDPIMQPLGLSTGEKAALVAFMKRPMTDPRVTQELPPFDRPKLYTESTRVPTITGTGRVGSGAVTPEPMAIEPPLVGNPSFTVAVSKGLGAAPAVLVINSTDPGVGASIPATGSFARHELVLSGTGAGNGYSSVSLQIPNNPALVGQTFIGRWYITDAGAASGFSVTPAFQFTVFGQANAVSGAAHVDFDGDRRTDISIFRPSNGTWWYMKSATSEVVSTPLGDVTDKIVPGDYTGDGKTDVAIYRTGDGNWYILRSDNGVYDSIHWGTGADIPAPADFDGDGKTDQAVFRPSDGTWYVNGSLNGFMAMRWGMNGDIPQAGDFDGDGKADYAIFRPGATLGEWWVLQSAGGVKAAQFGLATDKPVAADFTGDGKRDIAVWRPTDGNWYMLRSEDGSYTGTPWGTAGDMPVPGDYDGDGKTDIGVFRPSEGNFYVNRTGAGFLGIHFGTNGDRPVPGAYTP